MRVVAAVTFAIVANATAALAQNESRIAGTVHDAAGKPIAGATVNVRPNGHRVTTDAQGEFSEELPAGTYEVRVTKGGFVPFAFSGITVPQAHSLSITLVQSTLDTLRQIAAVQTSAGSAFNTSASAITTISQQQFVDQGEVQVPHVLDQVPGAVSTVPGSANSSAPGSITSPDLRGTQDWEKETLLDGHPLINGTKGDYPLMLVNSLLFDDVEVVKGPTAYADEVNYGIGGTLNFVTGEPTLTPSGTLLAGFDNDQGSFGELRLSDTLLNGKLGYLFSVVRNGTNGPLDNYPTYVTLPNGTKINGSTATWTTGSKPPAGYSGPYPVAGALPGSNPSTAYTSLVACCQDITSTYQSNGELAKLAYHVSKATTLTAGYVGIQGQYNGPASSLTQIDSTFAPGSAFPASAGPFTNGGQFLLNTSTSALSNTNVYDNEPMFESELRTAVGPNDTFLARYYSAVLERATVSNDADPLSPYTVPVQLYGSAKVNGVSQNFTGQTELVTIPAANAYSNSMGDHDYLHGSSFEYDHPLGTGNTLSFSYDLNTMLTQSYKVVGPSGATEYSIAPGTRQDFGSYLLRDIIDVGQNAQLTLANYYNVYRSTYAPTSSTSDVFDFSTVTTVHDDPRLGFSYRPSSNLALRLSAGSAISPPYPSLIDNNTTTAATTTPSNGTITINQNSGHLRPETSFSYDLGGDIRLPDGDIVSVDTYLMNVWNQFVTAISDTGTTYNGYPVFASTNENLAQSRYEGLELTLRRDPRVGWGYTFAGDLARAYAYNVSGNIYMTSAGIYETNLGVVPNINQYGTGTGYNGISNKSEAYSMGYAAIHRRASFGQFAELGLTYFGSNNTFNIPAYVVGHATYRQPIAARTSLQVSADNIFDANALKYVYYGAYSPAIPAPLINGDVGLRGAVPYGPTTFRVMLIRSL